MRSSVAAVPKVRAFRGTANARIYVVQDNLSAHLTPDVRRWARANRVSLVPAATNAAWLNPIGGRITKGRSLAVDGSHRQHWRHVGRLIGRAVGYRNVHGVQIRRSPTLPLWKKP